MASTRPPDGKVVKNPLLTNADHNAFFEEFAHSRLLVAPPMPHPVPTIGPGHVSSAGNEAPIVDNRESSLPSQQLPAPNCGEDPSSDQTFTEIPLTPNASVSTPLPASQPPPSSLPPPIGPPPTASGPPPSTGFIRSAPLSRYIPSNFIQTSLSTQAPLQIFQGAPSAPVGVSLLDPNQESQLSAVPDTATDTSIRSPHPPTSVSPPSQNLSSPNNPEQSAASLEASAQQPNPPSTPELPASSTPQQFQAPPPQPFIPPSSSVSSGFPFHSQPYNPVNTHTSLSSTPSASFVHSIPKATSTPGFPATGLANTLSTSKSSDFPFVPVFPKPNSGNFLPANPLNLANENALTSGLVPPQLRGSPSPLSSKHSTPPPGSQTPLLQSAERGSPSIAQFSNQVGQVEQPLAPITSPIAPPEKSSSPALVSPPPQVGPPPKGNSSPYPSALSRSALSRSVLGQHSSSSLHHFQPSKPVSEAPVQYFSPSPLTFPPAIYHPRADSFISQSSQHLETENRSNFFSSAASFFNLHGSVSQPQATPDQNAGICPLPTQSVAPPSSQSFPTRESICPPPQSTPLPGQFFQPSTEPNQKSSANSYFQPYPPSSRPSPSSPFVQNPPTSAVAPQPFFSPQNPTASAPVPQPILPPPPQNSSRPSSVGSISSLQSSGSFPPVASPFSLSSQKAHPPPSSYFTPISESSIHHSPSPVRSVTSSQGSGTAHHSFTSDQPVVQQISNHTLPLFHSNHFDAPPAYQTASAFQQPNPLNFQETKNISGTTTDTAHPTSETDSKSFENISSSFLHHPNTSNLSYTSLSPTDIPPSGSFANASSFFRTEPPNSQDLAVDSFSPQPAPDTKSLAAYPPQDTATKRVTPSHTPPPSYESLDHNNPSDNPNSRSRTSSTTLTDGPVEPQRETIAEGPLSYLGTTPSALPPASSPNQGNAYRRTSLKRPSYAPVPDLGVSHPPTEFMGQTQQPPLPGGTGSPPGPTAEGDRGHSTSPPSPGGHSQSIDFGSQGTSSVGHYRPAFHHWFYKKDGKRAVWQPFSMADSLNIEQAFDSPELSEATKVPTDGGRYDVEVLQRKKIAVYWEEAPSEVRRCSWFVKSLTEARYVPYDENIAEFLEEEYKQGCLTNEWDRRIELADNEVIVLSSPNSMAHHQRSSSPDNWSGGSPPTQQKPRLVKRGLEDFEISEGEPTQVDQLLLVVHGIGKVCDLRFRSLVEVVDDFRSVSLQLVQSHFRRASESGQVGRVEILPVEWHQALHTDAIDKRLADITLPSIPKAREFTNDTILDVLFYSSPMFSERIVQAVGAELVRTYNLFMQRNPGFTGGVSLGGHSLGSLILFDMLTHQKEIKQHPVSSTARQEDEVSDLGGSRTRPPLTRRMSYLSIGLQGPSSQPLINYPQLNFHPKAFFALGSPIGMFVTVRGIESLGEDFRFPTCPRFFNIFHPNDPVAYRIEALISNEMANIPPVLIPHHKGRKRMHLELKDTMTHITAALKQKLVHSVRSTWNTVFQLAMFQRPDTSLQREVDKALEEESLHAPDVEPPSPALSSAHSVADDQGLDVHVGSLNGGNRIDYVLQEAPLETFNQYISAVRSHLVYWESEDTMLMVLREIYSSMGIKPDSQVPQQILPFDINAEDHYSEYTDSIGAPPTMFIRK